jgi:hypothetical protein
MVMINQQTVLEWHNDKRKHMFELNMTLCAEINAHFFPFLWNIVYIYGNQKNVAPNFF